MANPARAIRFPDDLDAFILAEVERTQGSVSTVVTALVRRAMDGGEAQPGAPPGPPPEPPKPTLAEARAIVEAVGLNVLDDVALAKIKHEAFGRAATEAEPPKLTPADARAILEGQGFRVTTAAEMERLLAPAAAGVRVTVTRPVLTNPKGHHPATLTRVNVPERKPGKGAVFVATERTAGMSKNAVVRPALKARRVIGFAPDGSEVWG